MGYRFGRAMVPRTTAHFSGAPTAAIYERFIRPIRTLIEPRNFCNGKLIEARLSDAQLVMAELDLVGALRRTGPVIVSEATGLPYITYNVRRDWRRVADAAGIPKNVKNGGSLSDDDPSHPDVDDRSRSGG
jgi:hypothetical protein